MTALKKYKRLEAIGKWREHPRADFVDVLVSLGSSSIVVSDFKDNPISHWSLPSTKLVKKDDTGATFTADTDEIERLQVSDLEMVKALLLITNQGTASRKKFKLLKSVVLFFVIVSVITSLFFYPPEFKTVTLKIISNEQEYQIMKKILEKHLDEAGPVCNSAHGDQSLQTLIQSFGQEFKDLEIYMLKNQKFKVLHLPDGKITIGKKFLEEMTNQGILIKILKLASDENLRRLPLKRLIESQNTLTLIQFILGLTKTLVPTEIKNFSLDTDNLNISYEGSIDDFSWIAIKNICLN